MAEPSNGHQGPKRSGAPGLRVGTHNVNGLRAPGKLWNLISLWARDLRLDVVCLQETKIGADDVAAMGIVENLVATYTSQLLCPAYTIYWAGFTSASAGVAVLVRSDLVAALDPEIAQAAPDGRLIAVDLKWDARRPNDRLRVVSVYLPDSRPAEQAVFVAERIRPLVMGRERVVVGGDFNFVEDPRDRARVGGVVSAAGQRDSQPAAAMRALTDETAMRDAFRLRRPTEQRFTYYGHSSAARLDRMYVSPTLVPRVFACDAAGGGGSDHRAVALHLSLSEPEDRGPGRPRVRAHFWVDEDLAARFQAWFQAELAQAPLQDASALLRWWGPLKRRLAHTARTLDKDLAQRRAETAARGKQADDALTKAREDVEAGLGVPDALLRVQVARHAAAAARRRYDPPPPPCVRRGEQTPASMAAAMRPPASARRIAALRVAGGALATDGPAMAAAMATAVAAVSKQPPDSPGDRASVLAAVREHSLRVPEALGVAAGSMAVTDQEVAWALKHSKQGTAPGPDGIPIEVWRRLGTPAHTLLAAVLTAAGTTGQMPRGFLDGVVTAIYKAGDATETGNYRPLTMLDSDYRVLAKVLAKRLGPILDAIVSPEQTAFIAGRRISDSVALLQMLPGLLAANAASQVGPTGAVMALLDFRKAYDTVDRTFLLEVMEAVGVGEGMLAWVRLILSNTYAAAEVNGHISTPRRYEAGVRQGCPAAPALWLFVGHALACWLRSCPVVGIEVTPGCVVRCPQFADDTNPLLRSRAPADIAAFLETMAVFGRASGQHLNPVKCSLLLMGSEASSPRPPSVAGLRVVTEAKCLGVRVSDGPPLADALDGESRVCLAKAYTKLARFPLSAFGRGQAAATYGVSRILYRAVNCGLTPEAEARLQTWTDTLVDQGIGPTRPCTLPGWAASAAGVPHHLLVGRPAQGGFGATPWQAAIKGQWVSLARRYAAWAAGAPGLLAPAPRLPEAGVVAECPPLPQMPPVWLPMALAAVGGLCSAAHPGLVILMAGFAPTPAAGLPEGVIEEGVGADLRAHLQAGPLQRMLAGMQALGPVARIPGRAQTAELWGAAAPLWGNPLLQMELPAGMRTVEWAGIPWHGAAYPASYSLAGAERWRARGFATVRAIPGLRTVLDLLRLDTWLATLLHLRCPGAPPASAAWLDRSAAVLPPGNAASALRVAVGEEDWRTALCLCLYGGAPPPMSAQAAALLEVRMESDPLSTAVTSMLAAVPAPWVAAARTELGLGLRPLSRNPEGERAAAVEILKLVGWPLPCLVAPEDWERGRPGLRRRAAPPPPLLGIVAKAGEVKWAGFADGPGVVGAMSNKLAVACQLRGVTAERRQLRATTVAASHAMDCAFGAVPASPAVLLSDMRDLEQAMPGLWRLPLHNACKEPIWRLWVNGLARYGVSAGGPGEPCPCSWRPDRSDGPTPDAWRGHRFWECPVAAAVVRCVAAALPPRREGPVVVLCQHIWLLRPPCKGVHAGVWAVVAAVAVAAMERGRRHLWRLAHPCARGRAQTALPAPTPADVVARAGDLARVDFWDMLSSFVTGAAGGPGVGAGPAVGAGPGVAVPRGWATAVDATHPFIGVEGGAPPPQWWPGPLRA